MNERGGEHGLHWQRDLPKRDGHWLCIVFHTQMRINLYYMDILRGLGFESRRGFNVPAVTNVLYTVWHTILLHCPAYCKSKLHAINTRIIEIH